MTGRCGCGRTLAVARNSSCPERVWLNAVAPLLLKQEMVFINAGANKGYHVAEFLQRFFSDAAEAAGWRTNGDWMAAMRSVKRSIHTECGVCRECTAPPPTIRLHAPSVQVHAFELMACNHHLIDSVFRKLRVPGTAYRMAVANRSGVVYGPSDCRMGNEGSSALMRNKPGRHARSNCTRWPCTTEPSAPHSFGPCTRVQVESGCACNIGRRLCHQARNRHSSLARSGHGGI